MVSFIKSIGLNLCSIPGYFLRQTRAKISRSDISPSSDKENGKIDATWAVALVKGKQLYAQNWQNSFWKAISSKFSQKTYTTVGNLIYELYILNENVLEWKVKDNMTLGQFLFEDERGSNLFYKMIVKGYFPLESIEEKDRIKFALSFIESEGIEISDGIQHFGIKDQEALLQIAHKCLEHEMLSLNSIDNIKNFGFKDQKSSILSLLEASIRKNRDIENCVEKLKITDKAELIKLAKLWSEQKEIYRFSFFDTFSKQSIPPWDKRDWLEVISVAIKEHPKALLQDSASWEHSIDPLEVVKLIVQTHPEVALQEVAQTKFLNPMRDEDIFEIIKIAIKKIHAENQEVREELESLDTLFKQIANYRSPQARKNIIQLLFNFENVLFLKKWAQLIKGKEKKAVVHTMIPTLLTLSSTQDETHLHADKVSKFMDIIHKERTYFKKASNMHLLVNFLIQLNLCSYNRNFEDTSLIISQVFSDKSSDDRLRLLTTLLYLHKEDAIDFEKPISNEILSKMCHELICEVLHIDKKKFGGLKSFDQLYKERVEDRFRDKDALMVYAGKINSLEDPYVKKAMQEAFSEFVNALLKNEFYQLRNQSPQIHGILKLKGGEALVKMWNDHPKFEPLTEYLQENGDKNISFSVQFEKFLTEKLLADNHIERFSQRLPFLARFLNKKSSPLEILRDIEKIPSDKNSLELQKCCLELLLCKNKDDKLLANLQDLLKILKGKEPKIWDEFTRDVVSLVNSFKVLHKENMTIGITNDPCDMFMLGRETGGCQSIDGDPEYNKCALAYVIDGKNCAIAIKDKDGSMKARAILRLLIDENTNKPVLFLERHYLSISHPSLSEAITSYAIKYAKRLSLTLLATKELPRGKVYKKHGWVVSLGSNAPFEYSDAAGGRTDGRFTVPGSAVLYDPITDKIS